MTDLEKMKNLFNGLGIPFQMIESGRYENDKEFTLHCEPTSERIVGHSFFYTDFRFDKDGKFINMGIWG